MGSHRPVQCFVRIADLDHIYAAVGKVLSGFDVSYEIVARPTPALLEIGVFTATHNYPALYVLIGVHGVGGGALIAVRSDVYGAAYGVPIERMNDV